MQRTCVDCGKTFEITAGEEKFYKDKGLSLPKRCKECRERNRNASRNGNEKTAGADKMLRDIRTAAADNEDEPDYKKPKKGFDPKKILPTVIFLAAALAVIAVFSLVRGDNSSQNDSAQSSTVTSEQTSGETTTQNSGETTTQNSVENSTQNSGGQGSEETSVITSSQASSTYTYNAVTTTTEPTYTSSTSTPAVTVTSKYKFRNNTLLSQHYQKHGKEMGFASAAEYQAAASAVIENPSSLHKTEAEDGDDVYYLVSTGEFVIKSTDGYIRTYYIADYDYYERQ